MGPFPIHPLKSMFTNTNILYKYTIQKHKYLDKYMDV